MLDSLVISDFLAALIAFALVLIPVVIIHELGHFFAAKLVGISVLEFGIGFPPRVIKLFRWGETDFTLNLLPIGGFVRPLGEDMIGPQNTGEPADAAEEYTEEKRKNSQPDEDYITEREELLARGVSPDKIKSVNDVKPLPRIFFMAAGALANFATAVVLFTVVALIGLPIIIGARVQVTYLPENSMFAGTPVQAGDAIERINGELFTGTLDLLSRMQSANGPVTLTLLNPKTGKNNDVTVTPKISSVGGNVLVTTVMAKSPAHEAGLVAGDIITRVDGKTLPGDGDPGKVFQEITAGAAGRAMSITVLRENRTLELSLVPRVNPPKGEGRIGIAILALYVTGDNVRFAIDIPQEKRIPQPLDVAVKYGFKTTGYLLEQIISIPGKIISGAVTPEQARPVSIIGISQIGGSILKKSLNEGTPVPILEFIAMVSIFLGFTNLLPLPALDGGRILFALVELVRGKPVSPAVESRVHWLGFIILMLLGLLVILYDIFNPFVMPN
jgi:regulator of sigma E protease